MSQQIWNELSRIALTGADRGRLSDVCRKELEKLGVPKGLSETEAILEGAALLSVRQKAGYVPRQLQHAISSDPKEETLETCSPKSADHLRLILDGPFAAALPEFVDLLAVNKLRLPPESLPALLDRCREEPALWPQLSPAVGKLGQWLISQNPLWQTLDPPVDPQNRMQAGPDEKLAIIQKLRQEDPPESFRLLKEEWKEAVWKRKVSLLETLRIGSIPEDEPFLEQCLDESRKEVRTTAAALLAVRPDSALVQRAIGLAKDLIAPSGNDKLTIELPEAGSDLLLRDGIGALATTGKISLRQGLLAEIVRRVPPSIWEAHFDAEPLKCLSLFAGGEYPGVLLPAITDATYYFRQEKWMEAFYQFWGRTMDRKLWQNPSADRLLSVLPNALFNSLSEETIAREGLLVEEDSPFGRMLLLDAHSWPDSLSVSLIKGFQQWLGNADQFYWNTWHYKKLLSIAGYRANPDLFEQLRDGWPYQARLWPSWEKDVDGFLRTLFFRRDMHKALTKGKPHQGEEPENQA